ncbi:hypothetical protein HK101_007321 [Irineochytrium annulatum]|nr:hypothetical protein HK101_007321 [Irineochytrium annulatum]
MRSSSVTDGQLRDVAPRCQDLTTLLLDACPHITDDGIVGVALSRRTGGGRLRRVDVAGCQGVTDLSMRALTRVAGSLMKVAVRGSGVTWDGVVALRAACGERLVMDVASGAAVVSRAVQTRDMGVQTDEKQPEAVAEAGPIARVTRRASTSAEELLMKFAEAVASGDWTPHGPIAPRTPPSEEVQERSTVATVVPLSVPPPIATTIATTVQSAARDPAQLPQSKLRRPTPIITKLPLSAAATPTHLQISQRSGLPAPTQRTASRLPSAGLRTAPDSAAFVTAPTTPTPSRICLPTASTSPPTASAAYKPRPFQKFRSDPVYEPTSASIRAKLSSAASVGQGGLPGRRSGEQLAVVTGGPFSAAVAPVAALGSKGGNHDNGKPSSVVSSGSCGGVTPRKMATGLRLPTPVKKFSGAVMK